MRVKVYECSKKKKEDNDINVIDDGGENGNNNDDDSPMFSFRTELREEQEEEQEQFDVHTLAVASKMKAFLTGSEIGKAEKAERERTH